MTRPRRNDVLIPLLTVSADFIAIVGAFYLAFIGRFSPLGESVVPVTKGYPEFNAYFTGSLLVAVVWIFLFNSRRVYRARRQVDLSSELFQIIRIVSFGMLIVMSMAFFYRDFSYSRVVFILIWVLAVFFIFFGRAFVLEYEKYLYRRGKELRNVLLIGTSKAAQELALRISQEPALGYRLSGYVSGDENRIESVSTVRLGTFADIPSLVERLRIETLLVCLDHGERELLKTIFDALIGRNIQIVLQSDVIGITPTRLRTLELFGIPFLGVKDIPMTSWNRFLKRLFDLVFSTLVLLLFLPFAIPISILIVIESGYPIFYRQRRIGLDGRQFTLYKFRTMRTDAESKTGPTWTKRGDPRITSIGRFLRRLSLDEIPQFINVLTGDMSVVGPRPERPEFVAQFRNYVPKYLERHRVKTGLTGWAQVSGLRGEVPIVERTKYDLYYIENWSFLFDLRIIFKTVRAVLFGKDAY